MTAINFTAFDREYLLRKIKSGVKVHTIRKENPEYKNGLRRIRPEIELQLYWKMRTKYCEKIMDTVCSEVYQVRIDPRERRVWRIQDMGGGRTVSCPMMREEKEQFWWEDGFEREDDFFTYFKGGGIWWVFCWPKPKRRVRL